MRQAIGASRRHVLSEVLAETLLVAAGRRPARPRRRARGASRLLRSARRRTSAARRAHRLRCAAGARRARGSDRAGHRDRRARRLVSSCACRRPARCMARVPRRHGRRGSRSAPSPRFRGGADRPGLRAALGRRPARAEPRRGHAASSRVPPGQRPHRPDDPAGTDYPDGIASSRFTERLLAALASPAGSGRVRVRDQRAAERHQQQERRDGARDRRWLLANRPAGSTRTASAATTSPRWATPLQRGTLPRRRTIRGAPSGSASWTKSSRDATGRTAARSASRCFRGPSEGPAPRPSPSSASSGRGQTGRRSTEDEALGAVYYPFAHRADRDHLRRDAARACGPGVARSNLLREAVANHRSRAAGHRHPVDGRPHRRQPGHPPIAGAAGAAFLRDRAAAHRHRHLRRAELRRVRAPARDRPAHGARRAAEQVRRQFLSSSPPAAGRRDARSASAGTWLAGQAMQAILFQVPAVHLATLAFTTAVVSAVSLAACLAPVRRAARTPPMIALAE